MQTALFSAEKRAVYPGGRVTDGRLIYSQGGGRLEREINLHIKVTSHFDDFITL